MKYFLDTEFDQTKDPVRLLSIGIVSDRGEEFYAVNDDEIYSVTDSWLLQNVMPILDTTLDPPYKYGPDITRMSARRIRTEIEDYIADTRDPNSAIEFWGYFAAYDWYLFTRIWGWIDMPRCLPKLCMDVKQYQKFLGVHQLPSSICPEHNSLVDARWTKMAWEFLDKKHHEREV